MRTVLVGLPLVVACAHERPLSELHEVAGKRVVVETHQHEEIQAVAIPASRPQPEDELDGVAFATSAGVLPPNMVARVTEVRRGRGALQGAGIGFLIGASIGAVLGYTDGDDQCANSTSPHPSLEPNPSLCITLFTAGEKALLAATVIGGTGAIFGTLVGWMTGSNVIYSYGEQIRVTPTGPPGSVGGVTIKY